MCNVHHRATYRKWTVLKIKCACVCMKKDSETSIILIRKTWLIWLKSMYYSDPIILKCLGVIKAKQRWTFCRVLTAAVETSLSVLKISSRIAWRLLALSLESPTFNAPETHWRDFYYERQTLTVIPTHILQVWGWLNSQFSCPAHQKQNSKNTQSRWRKDLANWPQTTKGPLWVRKDLEHRPVTPKCTLRIWIQCGGHVTGWGGCSQKVLGCHGYT